MRFPKPTETESSNTESVAGNCKVHPRTFIYIFVCQFVSFFDSNYFMILFFRISLYIIIFKAIAMLEDFQETLATLSHMMSILKNGDGRLEIQGVVCTHHDNCLLKCRGGFSSSLGLQCNCACNVFAWKSSSWYWASSWNKYTSICERPKQTSQRVKNVFPGDAKSSQKFPGDEI